MPATSLPATALHLPQASLPAPQPWWRYGHVWMVVGGPALVVVASFATLVLALRQPDPVVAGDAYRHGVRVDAQTPGSPSSLGSPGARALMPALQGRDHAVSPVPPAAPPPQGDR